MIAAMMTAANLGARFTGWGFVVFLVGSLCWSAVGITTGQTNLLVTNAFLTVVNVVGIWRWLGRQRVYEKGGNSAQRESRRSATPTLFTASGIAGMAIEDEHGKTVGNAVEALLECRTGEISYVVVTTGGVSGIAEQLRAVPSGSIAFGCDRSVLRMTRAAYDALPLLESGEWPAAARFSPAEAPSR
jgi:hypothetical protein